MKAAALFSGGKDSLYATYLVEKKGVAVDHLITLLPTLDWPSPHAENIEALKMLAESMGKNLAIVDFKKEKVFIDALSSLDVDALVAGDVFVESHVQFFKEICNRVGLELLVPLYGRNSLELFDEIFCSGFKALVNGVNLKFLREDLLGFVISEETRTAFLSKIKDKDPLGENGEFHTLVIECPLYSKAFKLKSSKEKMAKDIAYLTVSIE